MIIPIDVLSLLFALVLTLLGVILWRMHGRADSFDLRDIICERSGGEMVVSTSKSLLAGAFLVSSYWVIKNPTDVGYAAYLTAWVANGGIVAWRKTKTEARPA